MKVLVVKTSSMGDIIHTFPAVTDLRRHRPDIEIGWCVEAPFAEIVALHPAVERIHRVALRTWRKSRLSPATRKVIRQTAAEMRAEKYDVALDAQGLMKSAFAARLSGAPVWGLGFGSARESVIALRYAKRFRVDKNLHAIDRTRLLFGAAFGYTPDLDSLDYGLGQCASDRPASGAPTAFLLHGTSRDDKKWPTASWVDLARELARRGYTPVATWSDDAEKAVAGEISAQVPEAVIIDNSPLGEIARAIARSDVVIGADTGLVHLASAFERPTVAIFLASQPELTRPLGRRSAHVERDNDAPGVPVAQVLAKLDAVLAT